MRLTKTFIEDKLAYLNSLSDHEMHLVYGEYGKSAYTLKDKNRYILNDKSLSDIYNFLYGFAFSMGEDVAYGFLSNDKPKTDENKGDNSDKIKRFISSAIVNREPIRMTVLKRAKDTYFSQGSLVYKVYIDRVDATKLAVNDFSDVGVYIVVSREGINGMTLGYEKLGCFSLDLSDVKDYKTFANMIMKSCDDLLVSTMVNKFRVPNTELIANVTPTVLKKLQITNTGMLTESINFTFDV